jgi:hypothetical protein
VYANEREVAHSDRGRRGWVAKWRPASHMYGGLYRQKSSRPGRKDVSAGRSLVVGQIRFFSGVVGVVSSVKAWKACGTQRRVLSERRLLTVIVPAAASPRRKRAEETDRKKKRQPDMNYNVANFNLRGNCGVSQYYYSNVKQSGVARDNVIRNQTNTCSFPRLGKRRRLQNVRAVKNTSSTTHNGQYRYRWGRRRRTVTA